MPRSLTLNHPLRQVVLTYSAFRNPTSLDRVRYRQTSMDEASRDWDITPSDKASSANASCQRSAELPAARPAEVVPPGPIVESVADDRLCDWLRRAARRISDPTSRCYWFPLA